MRVSYEKIIKKLKEETNLDEDTIELKIKEKKKELSGLVSRKGAAHIVANKLGVNLIENLGEERLKIKNLVPGLRSVDVAGKVTRTWQPRKFESKDGKEGEVGNFLINDGTGKAKIVIWDNRTKLLKKDKIKEGQIVRVIGGYVKDSKYGLEVHLRKDSKLEISPEGLEISEVSESGKPTKRSRIKTKKIKDLEPGDRVKIRAAMVSIFSKNLFYKACPECMKKLRDGECPEHGEVDEPEMRMVMTAVFDDGTGNIRATFFGKSAEILLGKETEEAYNTAQEEGNQALINQVLPELLGKELVLQGRVKKNERFDRKDLIVNRVIRNPDPNIAISKLLKKTNKIN